MALMVSKPTVHFGGALGAVGLALALGMCAWILTSQSPRGGGQLMATTLSPSAPIPIERGRADVEATVPPPLLERDFPDAELPVDPESAAPLEASGAGMAVLQDTPATAQAPAAEPVAVQPAQATTDTLPATFIVKFKPNPALDTVVASWRRDREAAEARFADWAQDQPVFATAQLVGASYSGELILQRPVPTGAGGVDAVVEMIRSHPAVSYADPDFTAHPGQFED